MPEKKTNFKPALDKGKQALLDIWKKNEQKNRLAELCGCVIEDDSLRCRYFDTDCSVSMPGCVIHPETLKTYEKVLLLHYLSNPLSAGPPPAGDETEWITFKQLPNAEFYNATYQKRGPNIILSSFADRPEQLIPAGEALNGKQGSYGDYSVVVNPLPKIDAMAVLYAGDDELPPAAEILFTTTIPRYLTLEDTAVLAGIIAVRLVKAAAGGTG